MFIEIQTTVCGGFPIIARGDYIAPTSSRNTGGALGGFGDWEGGELERVVNIEITTTKGKPAKFIESKMTLHDWLDLEGELIDKARKWEDVV